MDHNKFIAKKARETLKPLGFQRDGKSRVWYKDHGWWALVVYFQPSAYSKGTSVDVCVSNFLYEKGHWAFEDSANIKGYASLERDDDFESRVNEMTIKAATSSLEFEERYAGLDGFINYYNKFPVNRRSVWFYNNMAIIESLRGNYEAAKDNLAHLTDQKYELIFEQAVQLRAKELIYLLDNKPIYQDVVKGIVLRSRNMQQLKGYNSNTLLLPWK
jgi:hypothetical protein